MNFFSSECFRFRNTLYLDRSMHLMYWQMMLICLIVSFTSWHSSLFILHHDIFNYNDNSSLFWWILCWVSESSSVDGNHPLHGEIGGTDLSESWFDGLNKQKPYWNRWKVIREENSHCYFSTWEKFHFASFIFITVRFVFVFLLPQCIYVQWQCSKKVEWRN